STRSRASTAFSTTSPPSPLQRSNGSRCYTDSRMYGGWAMLTPVRLMTVSEFEQFVERSAGDRRFELIDGEVVEKMPNEEHGEAASNLHWALANFIKPRKLGRLVIEALYKDPA